MAAPTVAVLIATYNRADLLGETLDVLARSQTDPRFPWEVIVIDNNSTDATREVVTSRQAGYPVRLTYLFEARQGRSAALNTGMAATTAPLMLFTDDDDTSHVGAAIAALRVMRRHSRRSLALAAIRETYEETGLRIAGPARQHVFGSVKNRTKPSA